MGFSDEYLTVQGRFDFGGELFVLFVFVFCRHLASSLQAWKSSGSFRGLFTLASVFGWFLLQMVCLY
jgi:hypothetical protein